MKAFWISPGATAPSAGAIRRPSKSWTKPHPDRRSAARWIDYIQLLKPRVMSLVVVTGLTGLVCAGRPMPPLMAALATLCIALGGGGSAALNMWYDADIDAKMRRTRGRPVPAGRVPAGHALALGLTLSLVSTLVMGLALNWLAAGLLAFTIVFYAVVYTIWLKRRTAQNIVIGGLAGALPPVIGWAAATGAAPPNAWLLCGIIFLWTPPHFWALALCTSGDYARAGVPMLPVVAGAAATRRQILIYSLLFTPLCIAPAFTGLGGATYLAAAALGGLVFLGLALRLYRSRAGEPEGPRADPERVQQARHGANAARNLFACSILYLALLFATLLAEHVAAWPALISGR